MTDPNVRAKNLSGGQGFGGKEPPKATTTTQAQPSQDFSVPDVDAGATLAILDAYLQNQATMLGTITQFQQLVDRFRTTHELTGNTEIDARIVQAAAINHGIEGLGFNPSVRRRPAPLVQVIAGTARPLALPPSDSVA